VDQVVIRSNQAPSRADRKVVGLAGHHRDVPALRDVIAWPRLRRPVIEPEPVPPDEIAFDGHRPLLVLRREHQAADLGSDAVEDFPALPLRMQDLAAAAGDLLAVADGDDAILDRDGGQVEMLPATLSKEMAGKVVLVQTLHDYDDRAVLLIIEAGDQG